MSSKDGQYRGPVPVMSPLYYVFRMEEGNLYFFEKYFESVYWHEFMKMNGDNGVRADRFNIKDCVFEDMPIPFPNVAEQTILGNFFRTIDEQIASHQTQLVLMKKLKDAYLQRMFR